MAHHYADPPVSPRKRRAWDIANPGNLAIREELVRAASDAAREALRGGDELLDAGCGMGWWLARLSAEGIAPDRLHGVDLRERAVAAAARAAPGGSVRLADLRDLPYENGRFAAVFVFTVLSSLEDRAAVDRAVRECWRVLAPGGRLIVWEPRVPTPLNRSTSLIRRSDLSTPTGAVPAVRSLTLAPPLARRLGSLTGRWYPRLASVPLLRTHRLLVLER
jgi:SAM-dependent methyltransferase